VAERLQVVCIEWIGTFPDWYDVIHHLCLCDDPSRLTLHT
jgi:hypothetical protein